MELPVDVLKRNILGLLQHQNVVVTVKPELRFALRKALLHPFPLPLQQVRQLGSVYVQPLDTKAGSRGGGLEYRTVIESSRPLEVGEMLDSRMPDTLLGSSGGPLEGEGKKRGKGPKRAPLTLQGEALEKLRGESKKEVQQVVKENASNYQYEYPETPDYIHHSHDVDSLKLRHMNLNGLKAATLDLRNSGDTSGPRDQVVGYGAFAFFETLVT